MGKKVLIAGGMAGGASAAARVRRLDETAEIILFERGEYISYANCGLPCHVGGAIPKREALLLQALGLSVTIIGMLDQMMAPLDYEMALMLQEHLEQNGVSLCRGDGVDAFEHTDESVTVRLKSGSAVTADLAILSIGLRPNSALVKAGGLR